MPEPTHDHTTPVGSTSVDDHVDIRDKSRRVSLMAGGYIAARLAPARTDQSAVFHGLSIWALATIVMVGLGGTGVGVAVGGRAGRVKTVD